MPGQGRKSKAKRIGDTHKECLGCGEMKPMDDYYKKLNKKGERKHTSRCKPCSIAQQLAYHRKLRGLDA